MNAPQTRQRPAGTGREVEKQIAGLRQLYGTSESAARNGYRGVALPPAQPAPRAPAVIAQELYSAAEHLADLAEVVAAELFDTSTLSSADALLIGCGRLIVELRQRKGTMP